MMDDAFLCAADDGVSEVAGMTNAEKAIQPRKIMAIDSDSKRGTLVRLECGHDIWFSYSPDVFRRLYMAGVLYCASCVNEYLDSIRPAAK